MAPTNEEVISVLRTCQDPEIPLNIVDLGLVYNVTLEPAGDDLADVVVRMTLTSPGCPMANAISGDVHRKLLELTGVRQARVELVWEPSWSPERISPEGRRHLCLT